MRRSGGTGFYVPLSGGADSATVVSLVYFLALLLHESIKNEPDILAGLRKIVRNEAFTPKSAQEIVGNILFTSYLGSSNSSSDTKKRAKDLAQEIGSNHSELDITPICEEFKKCIHKSLKFEPKFELNGGSYQEDLSLQNLQARTRMVLSYLIAQLIPPLQLKKPGFLLVLGTGNLEEALSGYITKYDCSSSDINPIGSISKLDLKEFLKFGVKDLKLKSLESIIKAKPSAELKPLDPLSNGEGQTDEEDMGMTYEELKAMGHARKALKCGPVSMYREMRAE